MRDEPALPSAEVAIRSIRKNGDPFDTTPLSPIILEGATYEKPNVGRLPVRADPRVLDAIKFVFTENAGLRAAIDSRHMTFAWPVTSLIGELENACISSKLFWGFSGYASKDKSCEEEADAMQVIFDFLQKRPNRPRLVCDGGSGAGVLALCGVHADRINVDSLGFTPYKGVPTMGVRDMMVINKTTYQEREPLVATLPDILVCVGGGEGAKREVLEAIEAGVTVLLVMLRNDGPDTLSGSWHSTLPIVRAIRQDQLRVCEDISLLPDLLAMAQRTAASGAWHRKRKERVKTLAKLLTV